MGQEYCTLCELELPDPPITDSQTEGKFCCQGCLHVYKLLQNMEKEKAEQLREQTVSKRKAEQNFHSLPETSEEVFFKAAGMHCTTCESFLETLAERQEGVYRCEASYASELVKIYYDPECVKPDDLPPRVSKMGYELHSLNTDNQSRDLNEIARLVLGGFFGIFGLLLYILFLYPVYLGGEGIVPLTRMEELFFVANIFVMCSFVLFYTGYPILRGAWVSLSVLRPNMDLLISIAAVSAYCYSIGAMFMGLSEVYFDVTTAIILVVSIGNHYEKRIKTQKNDLLQRLTEKKISHAHIRQNGRLEQIPVEQINPGDDILVKAGERIPIDGTVVNGTGVVNEALITGESLPVTKTTGDDVISGTVLTQNALTIRASEELHSTLDELMHAMWNIQSSRSGAQRVADRIAAYFVPAVILIGIGTFLFHLHQGQMTSDAMLTALAVLIVSCPCALGLATPLAVASGIRNGLKHEIVFKSPSVFEEKADTDILAFDKTGTLTTGEMKLIDDGGNKRALRYASALEQRASHPIAKPLAEAFPAENPIVDNFKTHNRGISGTFNGHTVLVGKPEWLIENGFHISDNLNAKINTARSNGYVPVAVGWDGKVQSVLVVGDQLREDAQSVLIELKQSNKKIALITGDSKETGYALQKTLNPDFLFTEALPGSKSNIIKELKKIGRVAMTGDGSNDAPALAEADLSIAFGNPTAIATESAQIVIPNDRLRLIPDAFKLIQMTRNRIRQNMGWAFLYNIITIPLAVAGMINPLFAAVAMALSSVLVVSNSSREMPLKKQS